MTPHTSSDEVTIEAKLVALGVPCSFVSKCTSARINTFVFKPKLHTLVQRVLARSEDIAAALGVENVVVLRAGPYIEIQVPRAQEAQEPLKLQRYLNQLFVTNGYNLPLILGENVHGELQILELSAAPHVLVCGQTHSGKSILQSVFVLGLELYASRHRTGIQMHLVDMKGVDLALFKNMPHVASYVTEVSEFHELIAGLRDEISLRYAKLEAMGARSVIEANAILPPGEQMPFVVVVIDEFAQLIDLDEEQKRGVSKRDWEYPSVKDELRGITQISRAAGVHVIAATQRASVEIISGTTKTNFPTRICFRVPTNTDSRVVLDAAGAENLIGTGDMLMQSPRSGSLERIHVPFVGPSDVAAMVEYLKRL